MSKPTSGLQTGKCPKCSGNEIYTNKLTQKAGERCVIAIAPISFAKLFVDSYICLACGYLEEYTSNDDLNDAGKIDKIKEEWLKIS